MDDKDSARSILRKIAVTTLIGILAFPFTQLLFDELPAQVTMAAGFSSIALLVQFLVDFEKRLVGVERQQIDSVEEMRRIVDHGFSKVNSATELIAQVESAGLQTVAVTKLVQHAAGISPDAPRLVRAFAQLEIDRVSEFLRALAEQEAHYEGEDQDWLLGLTRSVEKSIDAISLPEVDAAGNSFLSFWDTHLGRHYLDLQRDAIRRGIRVRRVFVTEHDEMERVENAILHRICRFQAEMGIEVRLLYPSAVPHAIRGSLYDFILFDNTISYEVTPAVHVEDGENPRILSSRLVLRDTRIAERIDRYKNIWVSATAWTDTGTRHVLPVPLREREDRLLEEGMP